MAVIAITGATGYLGSQLARRFVAIGHQVIAIVRNSSRRDRLHPIRGLISFVDIDSCEWSSCLAAFSPRLIIHAATSYGRNGEKQDEIARANIDLPIRVLKAAASYSGAAFLNVDTVLPPELNEYARTKTFFRAFAAEEAAKLRVQYVDARIEQFYGPWDDETKFPMLVIRSFAANREFLPVTAGEQQRDFVYIDDVVEAFTMIADCLLSRSAFMKSIDIGSGNTVTIRQYVTLVQRLTGSRTVPDFGAVPYRVGEPMNSAVDPRALAALGWRPKVSLESGVAKILEIEGLK